MKSIDIEPKILMDFKKNIYYSSVLILKLSSEEDGSILGVGLLDGVFVSVELLSKDNKITISYPDKIEEIKEIYQHYLLSYHEYSLRVDTVSEDDKKLLELLKHRISWYSGNINKLEALSNL